MDDIRLGKYLIAVSIIITVASVVLKLAVDRVTECVDCIYSIYFIVWLICGVMIAIGFLLLRSNELKDHVKESQLKINKDFRKAKAQSREKEDFQSFLNGYSSMEQEVIEYLHTFEGAKIKDIEKNVSYKKVELDRVLHALERKKVLKIMNSKVYLQKMS